MMLNFEGKKGSDRKGEPPASSTSRSQTELAGNSAKESWKDQVNTNPTSSYRVPTTADDNGEIVGAGMTKQPAPQTLHPLDE